MIKKEFYDVINGEILYKTYSTDGFYIMQYPTGILYEDAVDIENSEYTYAESDITINQEQESEVNYDE